MKLLILNLLLLIYSINCSNLKLNYSGDKFFDNWNYNFSATDNTTSGNVHYLDRPNAMKENLTFVNDNGNAIIKVDNVTDGSKDPDFGRNSVKLVSNDAIEFGSLIVGDFLHTPFGKSVWGAFWMLNDKSKQDDDGEIDIFEGVNDNIKNQFALHTSQGCTQSNSTNLPYTGSVISTDCNYQVNGNQGCSFESQDEKSYGQSFSDNEGGVFAALWDGNGVQIWFFSRNDIPSDLNSDHPDPYNNEEWGEPSAAWPTTTCDMNTYFKSNMNLIFDITICGLWAGDQGTFSDSYKDGLCTDVVPIPSNYDDAYFEIKSIKVFDGFNTNPTKVESSQDEQGGSDEDKQMKIFNNLFILLPLLIIVVINLSVN